VCSSCFSAACLLLFFLFQRFLLLLIAITV
jgi:hypothetical protein